MLKRKWIYIIITFILLLGIYKFFLQYRIVSAHTYIYSEGYKIGGDFLVFNSDVKCHIDYSGKIFQVEKLVGQVVFLNPFFNELIVSDPFNNKWGYYMDIRELSE